MNNYINIVEKIDSLQSALVELSNDELRNKISIIRREVQSCIKQEPVLNHVLPEVYACIKETERRFTMGSIRVKANEFDKKYSSKYDFVDIDGDTAIYNNKWIVQGHEYDWDMIPYDEQLLGGIYLHNATAIEMATGEGKTLVAIFPAFLNALLGKGVHIMTTNEYLSVRDYEQTCPIYLFHGISVGCIEKYERKNIARRLAYNCDVTFGSSSSFIFDYLFDNMALRIEEKNQPRTNFPYRYAIIDELDSILIDEAQEPHIVCGGDYCNEGALYKKMQPIIQDLIKNETLYYNDKINKKADFTAKGKKWLEAKCGKEIFKYSKIYKIEDYGNLPQDDKENIMENLAKRNALSQLLHAYTNYTRDVDYIIDNKKIIIIDQNTGRTKRSSRWENGLHSAIEVKEGLDVLNEYEGFGLISAKNFFKLYDKVSGMSGTIDQVSSELAEQYGLNTAVLPTHKPCIRKDHLLKIFKNTSEKETAILKLIKHVHETGRPILVGCPSVRANERICKMLEAEGIKHKQLNAKHLQNEAMIISKAGEEGAITISTSIAGRGTDIKLTKKAREFGGLYVIGTSMFNSYRVDRQLIGRSGRQGDPGDSQFFTSYSDDILHNVKYEAESTYSPDEALSLFKKAQKDKEAKAYKTRIEVSMKDDTINPFRIKFYKERNSALWEESKATKSIRSLLEESGTDEAKVSDHIMELYKQVKPLVQKILINEKTEDSLKINEIGPYIFHTINKSHDIDIPFSDMSHMYTMSLNKKKIMESIDYFHNEYLRQNMLMVYDKCWTHFVNYILGDLDKKEINMLPNKFNDVYKEINTILLSRLINSTIPIAVKQKDDSADKQTGFEHKEIKKDRPKDGDLCPCGSGKKYCECHGKRIRNNKSVRR